MIDVLEGVKLSTNVLDKGFVKLVDVMPRLSESGTLDGAIVQAARVSYGKGETTPERDAELIRYLMAHKHTSPFEMIETKWHIKLPIFIARQWIRHRTASVNEISGRYTQLKNEVYRPELARMQVQSKTNHQGSDDEMVDDEIAIQMLDMMDSISGYSFRNYEKLLNGELSKELSRIILPLSTYTEWYWKIDLHNLFHFLKLRLERNAQYEIREYAVAMYDILKQLAPVACNAFDEYILNAKTFSGKEMEMLKVLLNSSKIDAEELMDGNLMSKKNKDEFLEKIR